MLTVSLTLVLALSLPAWWALDRFVIDHVEISDVSALEAEAAAALTVPQTVESDGQAATVDSQSSTDEDQDVAAQSEVTSGTVEQAFPAAEVVEVGSYESDTATISISQVTSGSGRDQVTFFVADVVVSEGADLTSAFANDQYGTNIVADTSVIAGANDAVFAINGDYYGFREDGILIRNGVVYRDSGARIGLAIYLDGTMEVYDETETTADELIADGVWNTLSFGPALVDDGAIVSGIEDVEVDTNFGNHSIQGSQPRTGLGMIAANHFVFVVVDGRSPGYSNGVTMTEFAQIFSDLGAVVAYNLDGGGSATMYFQGDVVNNPLGRGRERGVSDILYIGS